MTGQGQNLTVEIVELQLDGLTRLEQRSDRSDDGLSFILILVFGQRMIPFLFISPFLADLINREIVVPWTVEILSVRLIAGGYSAALVFLKRPNTRFDPTLSSMKDLVVLILVAAVSAAFGASNYVGLRVAAGLLPAKDFMAAVGVER